MQIIRHRVNKLHDVGTLQEGWGAEIDLRSKNGKIILTHDAFTEGAHLEEFLGLWKTSRHRGTLILNPKEDGLEDEALKLLHAHHIENFFFLDLSIPTTVKLSLKQHMPKVAIRVSEYEPLELAFRFKGKAHWVWVDCFSGIPPIESELETLRQDFKICLVSPELHAYPRQTIASFKPFRTLVDAVCTKHPEDWES